MKVEDIAALSIRGFLDHAEGIRLYELAGACLEIGGYCGKSSVYLGLGCREGGTLLFSIDHHRGSEEQQPGEEYFDPELYDAVSGRVDTFREFRINIERAGLEHTVVPIVSTSEMAARFWCMPLGLVFIDGSHSYPNAFTDYTAWMPHILPGGTLAIHDIFADASQGGQAPHFIYRKALASGLFAEQPMTGTLGVLRRLDQGEVPDDIRNLRDW